MNNIVRRTVKQLLPSFRIYFKADNNKDVIELGSANSHENEIDITATKKKKKLRRRRFHCQAYNRTENYSSHSLRRVQCGENHVSCDRTKSLFKRCSSNTNLISTVKKNLERIPAIILF